MASVLSFFVQNSDRQPGRPYRRIHAVTWICSNLLKGAELSGSSEPLDSGPPWCQFCLFVRDGILSVADYNSTRVGVVVVVVVVVVVYFFTMG